MTRCAGAIALGFLCAGVAFPSAMLGADSAGPQRVELQFQGRLRNYLIHVPEAPDGALVLAFHGGGQGASQMQRITGLDALADREHFIVAYPDAFERSWADGRNASSAERQGVDDVGFARAVVEDIARRYKIDRSRVFATGLSNGGILAHRLGCEAADLFVAIAPVIASIARGPASSCRPVRPVAVLGIQGVADPAVPFGGNDSLLASRATEQLWSSLNGCDAEVRTIALPARVNDGTSVSRRVHDGCTKGGEVIWYEIAGGGHRWPPEDISDPASQAENGRSSRNLNASEEIWSFFRSHARR